MYAITLLTVILSGHLPLITDSARILSILAFPGSSQYEFIQPLLQELAHRGHHITSVNNFPLKEPIGNFRDIVIEKNLHLFDEFKNFTMDNINSNYFNSIEKFYGRSYKMSRNVFVDPQFKAIMTKESFDLIIVDITFAEAFYGLGEYFGAPMVAISYWSAMTSVDELVGNITPLSYIPNMIMMRKYNQNMNFWRRWLNVIVFIFDWIYYYLRYMPIHRNLYEEQFPNATLSLDEAQKNFSLVLLNDHYTITTPRPYVPNMIEVAGLHIPSHPQPIAEDIKKLLDDSVHGVIYIKLNSLLPEYIMQMILNQLGQYRQLVIWNSKYQPWDTLRIPSNIQFHQDLSHHSLLSHPNIYLFISHGDYLDIIDSIYYGVPILGIPRYDGHHDDYVDNIRKIGNGISLTFSHFNEKSLSLALKDLLGTTHYRQEAKRKSQIFRDQQNTPMENAIYWIEHIIKYKGAKHMRNLGQNLNVWEFYNLDVFASMICIILFVIFSAYLCLNVVLRFLMNFKQ
ncbi:UDP-glycosyltransferase UGT4-like [Musca vetustissima]|uniref:UDP-glycosyltransferase UGT4-like n=1 Tax=Musca vetustissima TaxID=27455 RepID=UPI002AB7D3CA|nr:UDP-glycosyltransferase UGT4-like [Musca vetustissima]